MVTVAKYRGDYVRIVSIRENVAFSQQRGWILIEYGLHLPEHKRQHRKWVSADTRFDWVREFSFQVDQ